MELFVLKRDGRTVQFDRHKIIDAIEKAFKETDGVVHLESIEIADDIATKIESAARQADHYFGVEDIQDMVLKFLSPVRKDVCDKYSDYRNARTRVRDMNSTLVKSMAVKLNAQDIVNQNANIDEHSFGGRVGAASDEFMKQYALEHCVSPMAASNHRNNEIYIHDLSSYPAGCHNCLSIPFDDLLKNGFNTRQTDVRPANSVNTAFQLIAVLFQLQSLQQFGGVSATHLDWTMVPYVRKSFKKHLRDAFEYFVEAGADIEAVLNSDDEVRLDDTYIKEHYPEVYSYAYKMTEREVSQGAEGLFHNLNTLQSRSGNQLPFTSINFGTCTLPEGRMVTKALLNVSIAGVGRLHKTSVFPCSIFQCMKGVNREPGDPNYDLFRLALRSTAQRLYPNYANVDWSGNAGYDKDDPRTYFSTMGCRTANGYDINGFAQLKDGRGNICPVTIILPTLAMEVKKASKATDHDGLVEDFISYLDDKIYEAKDMLLERFEYICSQSPASAKFMYENHTMAGYVPEEGIRSALKHGTLAVGQLGLAEALQILIGCDHTDAKGMEVAKRIESLYKKRCTEFKEKYKLNFGVYYSPAENLCYTAMKNFKKTYGEIPNVSENDFFTNSMHVPVWKKMSPFEKIDIESQLTGYSSAGCITYVELDSGVKENLDALETLVNYAMDKDIPYFAINVPNDMCNNCGYTDEIADECPVCGCDSVRRLRRVTGYLTDDYKTAFNKGKVQEVEKRVKHWTNEDMKRTK